MSRLASVAGLGDSQTENKAGISQPGASIRFEPPSRIEVEPLMPRERAHALFLKLSGDLAKLPGSEPGKILCPLCLNQFTEEAIDLPEPELTEEHIIPGELGGTLVTLTCKRCNNTHGSEIDAHLVQRLRSDDIITGAGSRFLKGSIEIAGMRVPTDIEWNISKQEATTFRLRQFDPAVHDAIRKALHDGDVKTFNVNMSFDYIPLRSWVAVFRIAYLAMFRTFGYPYILSPAGGVVREIISHFENAPEQLGQIVAEVRNVSPEPTDPLQLFAVGGAVMVLISLLADTKRYFITFMPHPEIQPDKVLDSLLAAAEISREFENSKQPH
jgi:hypothetical protein